MLKPIKSVIHLHTAAVDGKYVVAYQDGEPIGDGYIEEIGEVSVKLSGEWYVWDACEFYIQP